MAPRITELRQTCQACPSQWEGRLDNGMVLYVRYRWGGLTAYADHVDSVSDFFIQRHSPFLSMSLGGGFDGCISWNQIEHRILSALEQHIER